MTNVTLGMWLFLASEAMLFGAVFSAYALLRTSATSWPHGRDVLDWKHAIVATVLLLSTTLSVFVARKSRIGMGRIGLVGWPVLFLMSKWAEWEHVIDAGLVPSASTFAATYFLLTGLHALHVFGGLLANLWIVVNARRAGEAMTAGRFRAVMLYWNFVDVVWAVILVLVYFT